jgi:hypothetical protein
MHLIRIYYSAIKSKNASHSILHYQDYQDYQDYQHRFRSNREYHVNLMARFPFYFCNNIKRDKRYLKVIIIRFPLSRAVDILILFVLYRLLFLICIISSLSITFPLCCKRTRGVSYFGGARGERTRTLRAAARRNQSYCSASLHRNPEL